ncbi:hypothetical protein, partial [Enterobacter intestinihominis]
HVGPVSAAPPGVKAGSVVRSGGLTPAHSPTVRGQTLKNATRLPFLFFLRDILKPTKTNTNHTPVSYKNIPPHQNK